MQRIGASTISDVLDVYPVERAALLDVLSGLSVDEWALPTECPSYTVQGVATHILGDDLSLLSRQRDAAPPGVLHVAERMPGVDFMTLLNAFNDQWVEAARFLSPALLLELLRLTGEWTETYYRSVDPDAAGEAVGMFGPSLDGTSPFWHAIAREYLERWAHHGQILRALGRRSPAPAPLLEVGLQVIGSIVGADPIPPADPEGDWAVGALIFGPRQQAADILTLALDQADVRACLQGPNDLVDRFAPAVSRDR